MTLCNSEKTWTSNDNPEHRKSDIYPNTYYLTSFTVSPINPFNTDIYLYTLYTKIQLLPHREQSLCAL